MDAQMHQQINLFLPPEIIEPPKFSFRKIVRFWGIGLLVMLSISGFYSVQEAYQRYIQSGLNKDLNSVQAELEEKSQELLQLSDAREINQEINSLREIIVQNSKKIQALKQQGLDNTDGFSGYLKGLSKNHVKGTWLTRFSVASGGHYLDIEGQAKDPVLIPEILIRLEKEPLFDEKKFYTFEVEAQENGLLSFNIEAKPVQEVVEE